RECPAAGISRQIPFPQPCRTLCCFLKNGRFAATLCGTAALGSVCQAAMAGCSEQSAVRQQLGCAPARCKIQWWLRSAEDTVCGEILLLSLEAGSAVSLIRVLANGGSVERRVAAAASAASAAEGRRAATGTAGFLLRSDAGHGQSV